LLLACAGIMPGLINCQADLFTSFAYKNVNATDVEASVYPINSTIALNHLACMYLCSLNSNCVLAVLKTASNNCSFYNASAQTKTVSSVGSVLYQKQVNG
jgi:hypothetical protein